MACPTQLAVEKTKVLLRIYRKNRILQECKCGNVDKKKIYIYENENDDMRINEI